MITGNVNADYEPIICVAVCSFNTQVHEQDAIVDTGFNGWLSLPPNFIAALGLSWKLILLYDVLNKKPSTEGKFFHQIILLMILVQLT